jgi:hypothetical protein
MPAHKKKQQTNSLFGASSGNLISIEEAKNSVLETINNTELQKALDKWIEDHHQEHKILSRDLNLLRSIISEYLDTYIVFGYNLEGDRIVIQHCNSPRDKDALMEFLKNIFIKQQHNNFLDLDN